jgi:uncharacterized paraquat-inducible protein A
MTGPQTVKIKYRKIEKCSECNGRDYLKQGLCERCLQTKRVKENQLRRKNGI